MEIKVKNNEVTDEEFTAFKERIMKQRKVQKVRDLFNYIVVGTCVIGIVLLVQWLFRPPTIEELDTRRKTEITKLTDKAYNVNQEVISMMEIVSGKNAEIEGLNTCIQSLSGALGTQTGVTSCNPKPMIPTVDASIDKPVTVTSNRLLPKDLFFTHAAYDGCHISQTENTHVKVENGGMFATDVACNFGVEGARAGQAVVFVPDIRGEIRNYRIEYIGKDPLLGDFIQLIALKEDGSDDIYSWWLGHTETKRKVGDIVTTGDRLGQNNLTGSTTGYHTHIEFRILDNGTWKSIRYGTGLRESSLEARRKRILYRGWKWGDMVWMTNYDPGVHAQNDASPCTGAAGTNVCDKSRATIALTVDVRESLGIKLKDRITIRRSATGQEYIVSVEDEMNARYRNSAPKVLAVDGIPPCITKDLTDLCIK